LIRFSIATNGFLSWFFRSLLMSFHSIDISKTVKIDKGLVLPHPIGITFGCYVVAAKNCTIYQNVTLGAKNNKYPTMCDGVTIYPNSVIVGDITLGRNATLGALSFLDRDLDDDEVFYTR